MIRLALIALLLWGCIRPGEERVLSDEGIGVGAIDGTEVDIEGAHVLQLSQGFLRLWAQAPVIDIRLTTDAGQMWTVEVDNVMPDSEFTLLDASGSPMQAGVETRSRPTLSSWQITLSPGQNRALVSPPDYAAADRWQFAVMGDIQTALGTVDDVFNLINEQAEVRFVISTGDLVEDGYKWQYDLLLDKLKGLRVPYFSTIGNHELANDWWRWAEYFGRYNIHFRFKTTEFSFVDAGNATIDPTVLDWLDGWLDDGRDGVHLFGMHYPAVDPVGVRHAGLRSSNEAALLLSKLAEANVDATFYGHLHSYYGFENAGIPAYISGGGGARPERFDGIGRHFLLVEVSPAGVNSVVRVDVD